MNKILITILGIMFIFLMTTLGAALVFVMKKKMPLNFKRVFLGFAAGVMMAASIWSLLIPALDEIKNHGNEKISWLILSIGFIAGVIFLLIIDLIIPHLHVDEDKPEGIHSNFKRTTLLALAVTIHNIPEGLAVGFAFGLALADGSSALLAAAIGLAIGIGLQNFPEGAAISLPLKEEGFSTRKAFLYGMGSGVVEPIFATIGVFLAAQLTFIMPWFLAFAAGAMVYVIVEELIPEAHLGEHSHAGTLGFIAGFIIMMILDIAFG